MDSGFRGNITVFQPLVSLFHDELVLFDINTVRLRAVQQVKGVDLHVNEFREIKRIIFLLILLVPENDDAVLHLFAAYDRVHTFHSYDAGLSIYLIRVKGIRTVKGLNGLGKLPLHAVLRLQVVFIMINY